MATESKPRFSGVEYMRYSWSSVPDTNPLDTNDLAEALAFLISAIQDGNKVSFKARATRKAST
jgi:hypothetical protein